MTEMTERTASEIRDLQAVMYRTHGQVIERGGAWAQDVITAMATLAWESVRLLRDAQRLRRALGDEIALVDVYDEEGAVIDAVARRAFGDTAYLEGDE